jgi:NDP-sugar pyrophosphorylase family protein
MVYAFSRELLGYFPAPDPLDFANDVFPALLEHDVPFHVHPIDRYWNDIGTLPEYITGNIDALTGAVAFDGVGELHEGETTLTGEVEVQGPVLIAPGVEIGAGASLVGPLVVGAGSRIGTGARLREGVLLPGAEIPDGGVFARGIAGGAERLASAEW